VATFEIRGGVCRARVRMRGVDKSRSFRTKSQAQAWAYQLKQELRDSASGMLARKTLRHALELYAKSVSVRKRGRRWEEIRLTAWCSDISPSRIDFVDMPMCDISTKMLSELRDKMLARVSNATVIREFNLLNSVFEVARKEWGYIRTNPLKDVKRPAAPEHRKRRVFADDIERICIASGWDDNNITTKSQEVCAAFLLAIETAMRQGELLGLTQKNVNIKKCVATLPRTKNGSSRDVPLSGYAVNILIALGVKEDGRYFSLTSATCDALFRKIKKLAGVEDLHFHDSRREATTRLSKKVDVLTLARITGHKDLKMLLTYYETDMSDVAKLLS